MNIEITREVHDTLTYIAKTYTYEVAVYLCGTLNKEKKSILINDWITPKQEVTAGHINVKEENLIELKNREPQRSSTIIGHYHSHHTLGAFWSQEDKTMQEKWLSLKPWAIFIVGSTTKLLTTLITKEPIYHEINTELTILDEGNHTRINEEIKQYVTQETITWDGWNKNYNDLTWNWKPTTSTYEYNEKKETKFIETPKLLSTENKTIITTITNDHYVLQDICSELNLKRVAYKQRNIGNDTTKIVITWKHPEDKTEKNVFEQRIKDYITECEELGILEITPYTTLKD